MSGKFSSMYILGNFLFLTRFLQNKCFNCIDSEKLLRKKQPLHVDKLSNIFLCDQISLNERNPNDRYDLNPICLKIRGGNTVATQFLKFCWKVICFWLPNSAVFSRNVVF